MKKLLKILLIPTIVLLLSVAALAIGPATLMMFGGGDGLGPELVQNSNLEGTYATYWTDRNTPTTNERSNTQAHSLTYSGHIVADEAWDGAELITTYNVVSGQAYRMSGWLYVVSGTCDIRDVDNWLDFAMDTAVTGSWQYLTTDASATATTTDMIKISISSATGECYFDDISVKKIY